MLSPMVVAIALSTGSKRGETVHRFCCAEPRAEGTL
jgi:hypothetical protein